MKNLNKSQRLEKVKNLYPKFIQGFKENVLQYGRTVHSLEDGEKMVFKVKMTECIGCGIPKEVTINVPKKVMTDFNSGKLNLAKATALITVDEGEDQ